MLDGLSTWIFILRKVKKVEVEYKNSMAELFGDQRGAIKNCIVTLVIGMGWGWNNLMAWALKEVCFAGK